MDFSQLDILFRWRFVTIVQSNLLYLVFNLHHSRNMIPKDGFC